MWDDQLYIAGRRDDLIIVRGLNRYPQDIEATARKSHPLLEAGCGAAFTVGDNGSQRLVLIHEVRRNGSMDFTPVLQAVCTAVLDDHDLSLDGSCWCAAARSPEPPAVRSSVTPAAQRTWRRY